MQPKEKKTPVKGEKPQEAPTAKPEESLQNSDEKKTKLDEKKLKSDEKKSKAEEKKQKSEEKKGKQEDKKQKNEDKKLQFLLFGQVEHNDFSLEKTFTNILSESLIDNGSKVEADPKLFDIEDESPRHAKTENKEQKSSGKKSGKEYQFIPFKTLDAYKAEKDNKKSGFANFFKPKLTRYLVFQDGSLLIGEKVKEDLKIKSKIPLITLFQISIEKENPKKLIMLFNKQQSNICNTPQKKCYKIDNLQQFFNCLKEELEKFGSDIKLQYAPNFKL